MVNRASDRAVYRQIADELRTSILNGELAEGTQLPTEAQLAERFDANRSTVRRSLNVLRSEGWVVTYQGQGAFVRRRPVLRRMPSDLFNRGAQRGWYAALEAAGLRPNVTTTIERTTAPTSIERFGVPEGTQVLIRRRLMGVEDEPPIQLATSYIPMHVVDRVPQLAELNTGPGGMLSRMEDAGYTVHFEEIISARMPLPFEQEALQLAPGVPVLIVYRITLDQDDQAIDVMERVVASDRCELGYAISREHDD